MNDTLPGLGHNDPPENMLSITELDAFAAAELRLGAFCRTWQDWIDAEVTDQTSAGKLTDFLDGLRKVHKGLDDARKVMKKPYADKAQAVDDLFRVPLEKSKVIGERAKARLTVYLTEQKRIAEAAKREAEAKAKAEAEAAAKALEEAQKAGDVAAEVEAEIAAKEAAKAAAHAAKAPDVQAKSHTGAGRTVALRTVKRAKITSGAQACRHYFPQLQAELIRLAEADLRAGKECPPGFEMFVEEKAA